jgi:pimeloyl-ACP methyl ester carboxylesterase
MAELTAPRVEGTVVVREGRKLGFAEFGPASDRTVVWLHGTPGARRQIPQAARRIAVQREIRVLGIDRPGVGLSTPHSYESIVDFVPDVALLLDQLDVERVTVIGLSGGGPYALATAAALPDRVGVVGILGGVAPTTGPDGVPGGLVGLAGRFGPVAPAMREPASVALHAFVRAARPLGPQALDLFARLSPEGDRRVLAQPEIKAMFLDDLTRNTRRGFRAPMYDLRLFLRHWGFELADVKTPVRWWHGDADHIVPLAHGQHVVPRLPDAELYVREGESHLGGLGAAEEVIDALAAVWDGGPIAT